MKDIVEKIVGIIVLLVAFGAVTGAGYFYLKSQKTRSWPAVEGVVTKSGTRQQHDPGDSGAPTTIADVRYRFVVAGIQYHNDTISLAQYGSSSARHAAEEARNYPVGSRVMVYYNPENPQDAVLEHKTPWIFIGIFAGLGTILIFIGIHMLSSGFKTSRSVTATLRDRYTADSKKKAVTHAGKRLMVAVLFSSALIALVIFYLNFNPKIEDIANPRQEAVSLPESHDPIPISTYSKTRTSPFCEDSLKAQVAERQKIQLSDGLHFLYVTATLCIDEEEMSAASQTHLTWPIVAGYLAAFDSAVYDTESVVPGAGEENTTEAYQMNLEQIEYECLARLNENGIFFVKAISLDYLQVFKAD